MAKAQLSTLKVGQKFYFGDNPNLSYIITFNSVKTFRYKGKSGKEVRYGKMPSICESHLVTVIEDFSSINWKKAKNLIDTNQLTVIGGNYSQINNQGEFTISTDGSKLYKRRHTAFKAIFDLIAKK